MNKKIQLLASMAVELCLAAPLVAAPVRTATEDFVTNKIAAAVVPLASTNDVAAAAQAATNYTAAAVEPKADKWRRYEAPTLTTNDVWICDQDDSPMIYFNETMRLGNHWKNNNWMIEEIEDFEWTYGLRKVVDGHYDAISTIYYPYRPDVLDFTLAESQHMFFRRYSPVSVVYADDLAAAVAPLAKTNDVAVAVAYAAQAATNYTDAAIAAIPQPDMGAYVTTNDFAEAVTTVRLADGGETMSSIASRLAEINAAGRHVFFDTASITNATHRLYLVTIYIDEAGNVVRVADAVTGKFYIGAYNPHQTLADVFGRATDAYVSITVAANTLDGVTVTNQTVAIYEGNTPTGPPRDTAAYDGEAVSFTVPKGFEYYVAITDDWEGDTHFGPSVTTGTQTGVANSATAIEFTYYDPEHVDISGVDTYAELSQTLALFGLNAAAARRNLVNPESPIEIPDTWVDENGTEYNDPMVCVDVGVYTNAADEVFLGCVMQRKYATVDSIVFDSPNQELADPLAEPTAQSGVHYFGFPCPAFDTTETYVVGAFAVHDSQIWRCKTAIETAGEWTGTANWTLMGNDGIATYDPAATYAINDLVIYNDGTATRLWKCTSANTTGDWAGTARWSPQTWDVLDNTTWLVDLNLDTGDAIPYAPYKLVFRNSAYKASDPTRTRNIIRYGHNRWDYSTYRDWLNSAAKKGEWWRQHHAGQVPPANAYTLRGYMAGCSSNLLVHVETVKIQTRSNTNLDSATGLYETSDTFWLPSRRQMYGGDNGGEGEYFLYWKNLADAYTGSDTSPGDNVAAYNTIRRQFNRSSSAVYCRLRSAATGSSNYAWFVSTSGALSNYGALNAYASVPACVVR